MKEISNLPKDLQMQILGEKKLSSTEEAIQAAQKINTDDSWSTVLKRTDIQDYLTKKITLSALLLIAQVADNEILWGFVKKLEKVVEYFNNIPLKEAISEAGRVGILTFWGIIFNREDFSFSDAFEKAIIMENDELIVLALNKKGVTSSDVLSKLTKIEDVDDILRIITIEEIKYILSNLSIAELISLAKKFDDDEFWEFICEIPKVEAHFATIPANEAVLKALEINSYVVSEIIFKRDDVKSNLKTLEADKIIQIGEVLIYDDEFWNEVSPKVEEFLMNIIDNGKAMEMTTGNKNTFISKIILKRKDISPELKISLANKNVLGDLLIDFVLEMEDVVLYLSKLEPSELIAKAEELENSSFWETILSMESVKEFLKQ